MTLFSFSSRGLRRLLGLFQICCTAFLPAVCMATPADIAGSGFCVQLGGSSIDETVNRAQQFVVHHLDPDAKKVEDWNRQLTVAGLSGRITVEHWTMPTLPHLTNLANLVVVDNSFPVLPGEAERITAPGGQVVRSMAGEAAAWIKPRTSEMDEWTHQWHGADGSIHSKDQTVGVPQGIQWITGPGFAMANRKSSTQSLVSAGGRNFYITQNVAENLDQDNTDKHQMLVARDAWNGLELWKRPWTGAFVTGDGETNSRMVALDDALCVASEAGVMMLDAAAGGMRWEYSLPSPATRLLAVDGRIVVEFEAGLCCLQEGRSIWNFSTRGLHDTVAASGSLYSLLTARRPDGSPVSELVRLDAETGVVNWRNDTTPWTASRFLRIAFADSQYVGLQSHGHFHLFATEDGRHLWSRETDARPGKDYVDERFVGHLYLNGEFWFLEDNSPRQRDGQNAWAVLDPATGKVNRRLETTGLWPRTATPAKMGCQLLLATDRHIVIPRQATFVDTVTGEKHGFKFLRGGCGLGFVAANGLIYSHPHACGCFSEAARGFIAAHSTEPPRSEEIASNDSRLRSTALAQALPTDEQTADDVDWPIHRGDPERSGFTRARIPSNPHVSWFTPVAASAAETRNEDWLLRVGPTVTAPTVSGDRLYTADVEGNQVVAIDRATGSILWRFAAGGRITCSPTVFRGRCLFGSNDGHVYCLTADEGRLLWRYRAAPVDRRIMAYGRPESAWPVSGGVLVYDDTVFAAAGRVPDADGGIVVSALNPFSGELKWTRTVSDEMEGGGDLLIADGSSVCLANIRFHCHTGDITAVKPAAASHLRGGKLGLLDASWTRHDLALRKQMPDWTCRGMAGQLLSFTDDEVVGYRMSESGVGTLFTSRDRWNLTSDENRQIQAMVLSPEHLAVAGTSRRQQSTGFLAIYSRKDGSLLSEIAVPDVPEFDGMSAAHQQIYLALRNGTIMCFNERD